MDAKELFLSQFEDSGYQLNQVFAGLPEESWDVKAHPLSMSARETAAHNAEAYLACKKQLVGEKHTWGSYTPPSNDPQQLLATMNSVREEAKEAALASSDPHAFKTALAYTASHDYYHVGQMATLRLHLDPEWDAYSIYKED